MGTLISSGTALCAMMTPTTLMVQHVHFVTPSALPVLARLVFVQLVIVITRFRLMAPVVVHWAGMNQQELVLRQLPLVQMDNTMMGRTTVLHVAQSVLFALLTLVSAQLAPLVTKSTVLTTQGVEHAPMRLDLSLLQSTVLRLPIPALVSCLHTTPV